jgi:hypothetical protein
MKSKKYLFYKIIFSVCCVAVIFMGNISNANANCETIIPVELDSVTNGALEFDDCTLDDGTLGDLYSITLPGSGNVSILLSSTSFDPWLFFFDENLEPLADNDDISTENLNSQIDLSLPSGTYIILVNEFSLALGSYSLTVFSDAIENPSCTSSIEISTNSVVEGVLSSTDCTIRDFSGAADDSYIDIYTITLEETRDLIIELSSTELNPFLWVISEDGSIVEVDDDSGDNFDARLEIELPAGTHVILTNSLSEGGQGGYTLSNTIFLDFDNDTIDDSSDNCPNVFNTDQDDNDDDAKGDACDIDDDNDGLTDSEEDILGTNPLLADSDGDGLSDFDEISAGRNPTVNETLIIQIINSAED